MSVRRLILLVCLGLTFVSVSVGAAQDGDVPAAAVVAGTCDAPGETVAALRDLTVRDGGEVLVSLTTIDLALADLLGDDHAVVLTAGETVVACGDAAGDADDVYVGVAATTDAGWGGVVWLHAREERTQVSLFVSRGLSGAGASPTEAPPPLFPTKDHSPTPKAGATRTPSPSGTESAGTKETYTSPSYGYSLAYDADYWRKGTEESREADTGSLDILTLTHAVNDVTLVGETGSEGFTALDLCDARMGQYETDPRVSEVTVREETAGDEEQASVAFDYTYTADDGSKHNWTEWIECYHAPDDSVLLSMFYLMTPASYDRLAPVRAELLSGVTFPGS
jgi:hypothetical protein